MIHLESLDPQGEVRMMWPSGSAFWRDHGRRQRARLHEFGEWSEYSIKTDRAEVMTFRAYVRDLEHTIKTVIANSKFINVENWNDHLDMNPRMQFDHLGETSGDERLLS